MVNQPLMLQGREGCARSSTDSETAPQEPHPTSAFPGTGRQRESKGSLIALPVGLNSEGRSQMWEQVFAEFHALLSAPGANHFPAQTQWASQGGFQHRKVER